jgi:hypothetical protein
MKHTVTVCAYRAQIFHWVNHVFPSNIRNLSQVVNFNVGFTKQPVGCPKVKSTSKAVIPVVLDARLTSKRATVICFRCRTYAKETFLV